MPRNDGRTKGGGEGLQIDNVARICALIRRLFGEFVFVLVLNKLQFRDIVFCHFERRSRAAESEESVFV